MAKALDDPIMIDPDLMDRNRAGNAIDISPPDGSLPSPELGAKALADARAAALIDLGGPGKMLSAPAASSAATIEMHDPRAAPACSGRAQHTMQWAARMPQPLPVYPHGAVEKAQGSDAPGCAYRAITFITPVPGGEVLDYYYTRAMAAGFSAQRVTMGDNDALSGSKGAAAYAVHVRQVAGGATEVELVTSGFSRP